MIANLIFKSYSNNLCPNQVNTSDANYQDDPGSVNKIVYTVYTQDTPHRWKAKAMAMEVVALLNIFTVHTPALT